MTNKKTSGHLSKKTIFIIFLCTTAVVVFLDLLTKHWVFSAMEVEIVPGQQLAQEYKIDVIPGFFDLQAVLNFGAFSGWFAGQSMFLIGVSIAAFVLIVAYLAFGSIGSRFFVFALGLIAGGTVGNLYDRCYYGAVRDFLHFYIKKYSWPNFNVADMAICIGVAVWIILEFVSGKKKEEPDKNAR